MKIMYEFKQIKLLRTFIMPLFKVEFKTFLVCISIAENIMRMSSSDKMDLHKDIVANIQFLSFLVHRGILVGLFEMLKSRLSGNWRKTKSKVKGVRFPMT